MVHAVLAALLVWEGPGLLDLAFLGSSVLYVVMALDFGGSGQSSRETFLEWGMASVLASLVVGLQVARWRAWAWVERTLVSGDMEMYAERYSALATSPTLTFPFTHASTLSALAPSPPHTHIHRHRHRQSHMQRDTDTPDLSHSTKPDIGVEGRVQRPVTGNGVCVRAARVRERERNREKETERKREERERETERERTGRREREKTREREARHP